MNHDTRSGGLLAWQLQSYAHNHRDRRNLLLHAVLVPLFLGGTFAVLASPLVWWLAPAGLGAMLGSIALQGRGHRLEAAPPVPFRGPSDVALRLLAEQWITFPRFVLSGGFRRAWRAAS